MHRTIASTLAAATVAVATTASASMHSKTIVDVAAGSGQFDTLVKAVKAAGLTETLKGEGPFTVFAPTDAAFDKLPEGALQKLLDNPDKLKKVLTYHVASGNVSASAVMGNEMTVESLGGGSLNVDGTGESVMVDDATVINADIEAENGVIHAIDAVLMPSGGM